MSCKCCVGINSPFVSQRLPEHLTQTKAVVLVKPRVEGAFKLSLSNTLDAYFQNKALMEEEQVCSKNITSS